jgi:hypothetical protein
MEELMEAAHAAARRHFQGVGDAESDSIDHFDHAPLAGDTGKCTFGKFT